MKPSIFILLFLVFIGHNSSFAQKKEAEVFSYIEQMPEFIAGSDSLSRFLYTNIRYPQKAKDQNIQGKVTIKFVVDTLGTISNLSVIKKINPMLDSEALRVVQLTDGLWKPGLQNGKPVSVYYILSIKFELIENEFEIPQQPILTNEIEKNSFESPEYKYGNQGIIYLISENLKYPNSLKEKSVYGKVVVGFIVDTNGFLDSIRIVESIHPDLDKEAIRLVNLTNGKWIPGKLKGENVKIYLELPITFNSEEINLASRPQLLHDFDLMPSDKWITEGFSMNKIPLTLTQQRHYCFYKGMKLYKKNLKKHAIDYFAKAYELNPADSESLYYIALIIIEQGKVNDGCKLIESLKKRNHPKAAYLEEKYCAKKPEEIK